MDAITYLREKNRMSKKCEIPCADCPLSWKNNEFGTNCYNLMMENPEKAVEIVEKWSNEHPVKTRQSEFLKIFPDTELNDDGVPDICPADLTLICDERINCDRCKKRFWTTEIGEEE